MGSPSSHYIYFRILSSTCSTCCDETVNFVWFPSDWPTKTCTVVLAIKLPSTVRWTITIVGFHLSYFSSKQKSKKLVFKLLYHMQWSVLIDNIWILEFAYQVICLSIELVTLTVCKYDGPTWVSFILTRLVINSCNKRAYLLSIAQNLWHKYSM